MREGTTLNWNTAAFCCVDVSDALVVRRLFDETTKAFGRVDIVISVGPEPIVTTGTESQGCALCGCGVGGPVVAFREKVISVTIEELARLDSL
jgi:NAD(P)-dependent dehydrogenase (short-subunit alcohol dehydrogenase family)